MKKILFVVTGFGYGDSIRVHSIIDKILKTNPETKILILGYDTSFNYFKEKFKTIRIIGYNFTDKNLKFNPIIFILKNIRLLFLWHLSLFKTKARVKEFDPDVIVSDFEPIANYLGKALNKKVISIFGFDPLQYQNYKKKNLTLTLQSKYLHHFYKRSYLNLIPSFHKQKKVQVGYAYIDPIIRAAPDELKDKEALMKKLKLKKPPVLVMLGGSNFGYETAKEIFNLLKDKEEIIIFGGKKQIPGYHYTTFQPNFLEYLKVSKAVITLAGQVTLSECLTFKKPLLVFPIKNHIEQQMNAESIKDIAVIGDPKNVQSSIRKFFSNLKEQQIKLNKLKLKSDGAEQAAERILNL